MRTKQSWTLKQQQCSVGLASFDEVATLEINERRARGMHAVQAAEFHAKLKLRSIMNMGKARICYNAREMSKLMEQRLQTESFMNV